MPESCFSRPEYWDLCFRDETWLEADFVDAVGPKYCDFPIRRVLEPGCGGGRLVIELAARGYDVTGFDLGAPSVRYVHRRLKRRGLTADVFEGDMATVRVTPPVDLAICPINTFRLLVSEADAKSHLEAIAASLRPGGLYVLALHLLPLDVHPESSERWTTRHSRTRVTLSLKVIDSSRRKRIETIRFRLNVTSGSRRFILQDDVPMRMYTAAQFLKLLAGVAAFEIVEVFDFWYDIDKPQPLDDENTDTVFVLRKR